jgi:phosphatidylglycerophosphate synthase
MDQVRATYKRRDAWWTVLLVDPLAGRLVRVLAGVGWVTPTRLTLTAFLLGLAAATTFLAGGGWLALGAVLYYASFLLDCVDGKVARLRGTSTVLGSWVDFLLDRVRVVAGTFALFTGGFLATGRAAFLLAGIGVAFLTLFGYVNGAAITNAQATMAQRLACAAGQPAAAGSPPAGGGPAGRLGDALHARRIRLNLVSGVEFESALFVIAPVAAAVAGPVAVLWVAAVAGGLLICFELALMARFWRAARAFDRSGAGRLPNPTGAPEVAPHDPRARVGTGGPPTPA